MKRGFSIITEKELNDDMNDRFINAYNADHILSIQENKSNQGIGSIITMVNGEIFYVQETVKLVFDKITELKDEDLVSFIQYPNVNGLTLDELDGLFH
ncbi:hypothetical protein ACFSQ3_00100 [Sphingobacterium corticis]|uniref:Uncharacterized protein n=1 Tax=Sphingobacterium corticis TaxID=1812823 RepID=A0ABW5NDR8_9SPHI